VILGSTQPLTEMSTRIISWGQRRPVRKADKLTTILCRCHEIWETLTSWNPLGHSRPVTGLFYLLQHPKQMHTVKVREARANTHSIARIRTLRSRKFAGLRKEQKIHHSHPSLDRGVKTVQQLGQVFEPCRSISRAWRVRNPITFPQS
jgi:hypothetical protein